MIGGNRPFRFWVAVSTSLRPYVGRHLTWISVTTPFTFHLQGDQGQARESLRRRKVMLLMSPLTRESFRLPLLLLSDPSGVIQRTEYNPSKKSSILASIHEAQQLRHLTMHGRRFCPSSMFQVKALHVQHEQHSRSD